MPSRPTPRHLIRCCAVAHFTPRSADRWTRDSVSSVRENAQLSFLTHDPLPYATRTRTHNAGPVPSDRTRAGYGSDRLQDDRMRRSTRETRLNRPSRERLMEITARRNADQLTASRREWRDHRAARVPEGYLPAGGRILASMNNPSETLVGKNPKRRHNPRRTSTESTPWQRKRRIGSTNYGASEEGVCAAYSDHHAPLPNEWNGCKHGFGKAVGWTFDNPSTTNLVNKAKVKGHAAKTRQKRRMCTRVTQPMEVCQCPVPEGFGHAAIRIRDPALDGKTNWR